MKKASQYHSLVFEVRPSLEPMTSQGQFQSQQIERVEKVGLGGIVVKCECHNEGHGLTWGSEPVEGHHTYYLTLASCRICEIASFEGETREVKPGLSLSFTED